MSDGSLAGEAGSKKPQTFVQESTKLVSCASYLAPAILGLVFAAMSLSRARCGYELQPGATADSPDRYLWPETDVILTQPLCINNKCTLHRLSHHTPLYLQLAIRLTVRGKDHVSLPDVGKQYKATQSDHLYSKII